MNHFMVNVPVGDDQVSIIKEQLMKYTEECGGFMLMLTPMNDGVIPPSEELSDAVVQIFMQLLARLVKGKFEGIN